MVRGGPGVDQLIAGRDPRWWLALGAALGLSALTKFSIAFFVVGLLVAVFLSPLRLDLRTRWPWLGAALAVIVGLPSLTGQIAWGWPILAQAQALKEHQLGHFNYLDFVVGQFLNLGIAAPLWLVGMIALLVARGLRTFRALGWLALTVFLLLLVGRGKDYYFGPMDTLLIAAAASALGAWLARTPVFLTAAAILLVGGLALLPMGFRFSPHSAWRATPPPSASRRPRAPTTGPRCPCRRITPT